ncbi:MAG: hypothetical protein M1837_004729 [Sclerophora amabilis]|nr:MAG: hypothetical protein M1837_004729 [Sclerophora amabilis]
MSPPTPPPPYSRHDPLPSDAAPTEESVDVEQTSQIGPPPFTLPSPGEENSSPGVISPYPRRPLMDPSQSPTTGVSDVILTPPGTPDVHSHQVNSIDQGWVSSSMPYLETRPLTVRRPSNTCTHHMTLFPSSRPDDLTFPEPEHLWLARDVTQIDWMTFLNYLLPHHHADANAQIADRKLRQELEAVDSRSSSGDNSPQQSTSELRSAQIEELRGLQESDEKRQLSSANFDADRRQRIGAVVAEWNEVFFLPRGLKVEEHILDDDSDESVGIPESLTFGTSRRHCSASRQSCRGSRGRRSNTHAVAPSPRVFPTACPPRRPCRYDGRYRQNSTTSAVSSSSVSSSSSSARYQSHVNLDDLDGLDLSALKSAIAEFISSANSRKMDSQEALQKLSEELQAQRKQKMTAVKQEVKGARKDLMEMMQQRKEIVQAGKEKRELSKKELKEGRRAEREQRKELRKEAKELLREQKQENKKRIKEFGCRRKKRECVEAVSIGRAENMSRQDVGVISTEG